jgi:predicted ArsR family transcriptional regulator
MGPHPPPSSRRPASAAEHRALAHPLRLQILRHCLDAERTNKELADELGRDPATVLHHVRMLVDTGFLVAGEPRRGTRGSREKPYLATRLSWRLDIAPADAWGDVPVAVAEAYAAELRAATEMLGADAVVDGARLGIRLGAADLAELVARLRELREDFAARDTDDGEPISLFLAAHRRPGTARPGRARPGPARP